MVSGMIQSSESEWMKASYPTYFSLLVVLLGRLIYAIIFKVKYGTRLNIKIAIL